MRVLLFVGAGVSAELGVPPMRAMAEAFRLHVRDNGYPTSLVERIDRLLEDTGYDMEGLVDDLDSTGRGAAAEERWGLTANPELPELRGLRAEAEWLVSHLCERVDAHRAGVLWRTVMRIQGRDSLTIATTNYDRGIELAALQSGRPLTDGFAPFSSEEYVEWTGFGDLPQITLLKTHGSTDWYRDGDGQRTYKLRHAMPLFGEVAVTVGSEAPIRLRSALVLPSREKSIRERPFPDIAYEFRKAVEAADLAAFVGTSLRDPDLLGLASTSASRIPTLVVSRTAQPSVGVPIRMSASRFLISVLPAIARGGDAERGVALATAASGSVDPILDDLVRALDGELPISERCASIDSLASQRISLEAPEIGSLLGDPSEDIRTFALGLVSGSPDVDDLSTEVQALASSAPESSFAREAAILRTFEASTA